MNAAETRTRVLLATVLLKVLAPRLQKYGITITIDDVTDLLVVAASAWHFIGPVLERFFPPKAEPAQPAKP